ncbi:MAG: ABC transporter substrate-binding protein [Actinomycetia bacterium]|nr:ABC transporter substrate-binding protein [Actinomycetes bacterium]
MRSLARFLALLFTLALVAAACGSGSDDVGATSDSNDPAELDQTDDETADSGESSAGNEEEADIASFPVTVSTDTGDVTIEARPERVVSMSATATEMLFALDAGDQVIAVDTSSNFPAEAPTTDLDGFGANAEAILTYEPDLVVIFFDPGGLADGLSAAGVPTYTAGAALALDDVYTQIEQLGVLTGNMGSAAALTASMQAEIDDLVAQLPERDEPLTYYHELDDTLFTVTSSTFAGEIYALAGLVNVADAADEDGSQFGYPQLSAEYLIDVNPDLVFLADTKCCGQDLDTVSARAGFDRLEAVQHGRVVELDDDIASRWGPRVVDFLRAIVEASGAVEAVG